MSENFRRMVLKIVRGRKKMWSGIENLGGEGDG
jgi:hypothetical protein